MKIITLPNKILREKAQKVQFPIDEKTKEIIEGMIKHIKDSQNPKNNIRPGIGIAAPQVGASLRMTYISIPEGEGEESFEIFLINPKIIAESEAYAALKDGEGCLSVDYNDETTSGLVHRKYKVIVTGYSWLEQKEVRLVKTGYHSIVLQHELDHLDGKLFIDRINQKNPFEKKENEILI